MVEAEREIENPDSLSEGHSTVDPLIPRKIPD